MTKLFTSKTAKIVVGVMAVFFVVGLVAVPHAKAAFNFTVNLKSGMTHSQVMDLQKFLNARGFTVSTSGAGSAGNETTYFGSKTKAAVIAFQNAYAAEILTPNGLTSGTGYFGSSSRAKANALETSPTPPGPTPTPTGAGLNASLASDSPTGSAIAGAGQVDAMKFKVSAGSNATITGFTFTKVGVLSDANISNLYLANESGEVVAQYQSLTNGVATFSGLNWGMNAGDMKNWTLRMDITTGAPAGNTIAWRLDSIAAGSVTTTGTPITSNTLTVTTVSNPSIATAAYTFNTVGSAVDAGTTGVLVASVTANVNNSMVKMKNIKFSVIGSANMADIQNLKLKVNGAQVGNTLNAASSNGTAVFDLSANPVTLNTGNATIELFADIMGSPNRNVTFTILRPYDVHVIDTQYNTGISPTITTTSATQITINQGQITVSIASDTPTGNIPAGASNVTLAKFNLYAAGEPVKIKFLDVNLIGNVNPSNSITNVKVLAGSGQVGNTINTIASGTGSGQCTISGATATCHFGTSSSQINYTVPANTTQTFSVIADINSAASLNGLTSLQATLPGNTSNLEGQVSFQQASSGSASGSSLTVVSSPLTPTANPAVSTQTYVKGATSKLLGSFVFTASSAEGARISSLTFDTDDAAGTTNAGDLDLQNIKVMVGSTQWGSTRTSINDGSATTIAYSGSTPITVNAGGSTTVDIYGDVLLSSTPATDTFASVIDLTGWSALGSTSNSAITFPGAVAGQQININSGATLTVTADSATPAAKQLVYGSSNNDLFKVRIQETSNVEDVKITDITFTDNITNGQTGLASLENLTLWDGSTQLAGPLSLSVPGSATGTVTFSLTTPLTVNRNSSKSLTVKGNVPSYSNLGTAGSNDIHVMSVTSTAHVVAIGMDSNAAATVSGTASGNAQTTLRTKLTLSASLIGAGSGRTRQGTDDLANLNFVADSAYQVAVSTVTLKFTGLAISNGSTAFTVDLIDSNTNAAWASSAQATCTPGAGNSCSVTFNPTSTNGANVISAGTTKATKIRANSSSFFNGASVSDSASVLINAAGDVVWSDGTTTTLNLESTVVPFQVVNVSYE